MLRQEMLAKRLSHSKENFASSLSLTKTFLDNIRIKESSVIAAYSAFRHELDVSPLATVLRQQGHKIVLPVVGIPKTSLTFRLYEDNDALHANTLGILEPSPTAPICIPDILLVPLLAFDKNRYRLGYGGGYYDRTIDELRAYKSVQAIGIAFSFQEVTRVPVDRHDAMLDKVVTTVNVF